MGELGKGALPAVRDMDDMTFQRLLAHLKCYPERPLGVVLLRSCPEAALPPSLNANWKNFCAQFTDNGQIIFPESEYQIFSHPNPPLRGFTDKDQLAIVAPFWDDADFSSHQGTIFYQVGLSKYGIQDHPEASKERQRAVWKVMHEFLLSELGSVWAGIDAKI